MEKSEYLELYRQMVLIRRLEETAAELYQKGEIGGFLHLYIGQEAVSTGIIAARKPQDHVITAYPRPWRSHQCWNSRQYRNGRIVGKSHWLLQGKRRIHAHGRYLQEFLGRACHCRRSFTPGYRISPL